MKPLRAALPLLLAWLPLAVQAQATGPWYELTEGDWRVPASTVADMRLRIDAAARAAVPGSVTRQMRSVLKDTVQYQGIQEAKAGRRWIEVNGMCTTDKTPAELRDFWVVTRDGGNCYYWARYDPVAKRFVSFDFNSAA